MDQAKAGNAHARVDRPSHQAPNVMETLFTITLLELFLGGGGRLLEVGPSTVRKILFVGCFCVGLVATIYRMRKAEGVPLSIVLATAYLFVHILGILIGLSKGNSLAIMMVEMQLSLYWLAAPFLSLVLRSSNMVFRTSLLIRSAGLILAIVYIGIESALAIGVIDFPTLYATLSTSPEFFFRSGGFFFYKGFLYLAISAVFFVAMPKRHSIVCAIIVVIALVMSITRGLILSTAFAMLLLLMLQRRWRQLSLALVVITGLAFFVLDHMPSEDIDLSLSQEKSNNVRINDFDHIVKNFRVGSLLFGEGLGTSIKGRINIENTFLWAFWRLGIVGVLFWFIPLTLSLIYFVKINRDSSKFNLACAYFVSTVLIYVQTITNPYLNNSIGLSFVLVAIFSLRTLAKTDPKLMKVTGSLPIPLHPEIRRAP